MKRNKPQTAASGGSAVLIAAKYRPGGTHGRRKPARGQTKRAAIREYS